MVQKVYPDWGQAHKKRGTTIKRSDKVLSAEELGQLKRQHWSI